MIFSDLIENPERLIWGGRGESGSEGWEGRRLV